MTVWTEFEAPVSAGKIVGWEAGSGTPALFLHGGPAMSDYNTEPGACCLTDAYRVVRYQQRGLPPSLRTGPYTVETHIEDAVSVLDALEIERAWAIGHSWGGHLAFHLAVVRPERCSE